MRPDTLTRLSTALADRYAIERELGRGGMATVYLAQDLKLHRRVALKVLRPELAASLGNERFLREIEIAARLNHPHILPLHDSGEVGTLIFYAMPYVDGESLRERLNREGQLPVADVVAIVQAVADALTYAHGEGIVHRDIKPENILLARDSNGAAAHALVADFGIARALDAAGAERLTETGLAVGTPAYMSPEQAAGDRLLDGRSDIYSLACLTYELLAGHPPFLGTSPREVLTRHALDPVPTLRTARPGVPAPIEHAITRAMSKVPADRFATALEFARALEARSSSTAVAPRRIRVQPHRIAVGLVLLAGGGAWLLRSRGSSVTAEAAMIAVLPFAPATADTMLLRLGQDLAATLSVSLDGVGDIRTVDRFSLLAQTAARAGSPTLDQAMALGRRFGAGSVLHGSLARDGPNVRLDGALYRSDRRVPLARVVVRAPAESLSSLTDSASWAILHQVWRRGEPPSPSLASVTTRSVPALREFLDGERATVENRWLDAAQAYGRAIAADSSFSLAYYRYAYARWWESDQEPSDKELLRRHRSGLSVRDSLMVAAHLADTLSVKFRLYEELIRRAPDYWPGWFSHADLLTHLGPRVGRTQREAAAGFRRVLSLKPDHMTAWQHLRVASHGRDSVAQAEAAARLPVGFFGPTGPTLWRRVESTRGRLDSSVMPLLDSIARHLVSVPNPFTYFSSRILLGAGFPGVQVELNRRVLDLGVADERSVANYRDLSFAWAARGEWDSAMAWTDRYVASSNDPLRAFEAYGLAVEGAWLGGIEPQRVAPLRAAAIGAAELLTDNAQASRVRARIAWYDGILAVLAGDRRAVARAREDVRESRAPSMGFLERSLAAFDLALAGQRRLAGEQLYTLEWHCSDMPDCELHHVTSAIDRLAAARWLRAEGDLARAARLLVWHEAGPLWAEVEPTAGPTYLERARIEETRGNASLALEYYDQFLRRYDSPMPALQPLVDEARSARARLAGLEGRS